MSPAFEDLLSQLNFFSFLVKDTAFIQLIYICKKAYLFMIALSLLYCDYKKKSSFLYLKYSLNNQKLKFHVFLVKIDTYWNHREHIVLNIIFENAICQ